MIKTLQSTLFVIALFAATFVQAQDVLLEENFDDSTLGVFTAVSVIGDGEMWQARDFDDRFFAQMNGFNGGIQDNEDWLISPALDMDLYDDEVLTFENARNFDGPNVEVLVSTDYDGTSDPNTATWTDVSDQVTYSSGDYEYVASGNIDLSTFEGTGYIAFKYVSNADVQGALIQIDDIQVTATTLSTSVTELEKEAVITTPVVRAGNLEFTVLNNSLDLVFEVASMSGRQIPNLRRSNVSGTVSIPVAELPRGMYVLVSRSGSFVRAHKFILN